MVQLAGKLVLFSSVFSACCEKTLQFRICACAFYWQKCELIFPGALIFSRCANMIVSISVATKQLKLFYWPLTLLIKGFSDPFAKKPSKLFQKKLVLLVHKISVFEYCIVQTATRKKCPQHTFCFQPISKGHYPELGKGSSRQN